MANMLNINELVQLGSQYLKGASKGSAATYSFGENSYSFNEVVGVFNEQYRELAHDWQSYRENKNKIFTILERTFDDVLPKRVEEIYGLFAEIQTVPQGTTVKFKQRITAASRRRAKRFVGRVGLAGIYETFRLDGKDYEITMNAIGGAAAIGLEEMLDGKITIADVFDIVLEGMDEAIYKEIMQAMKIVVADLQDTNKHSEAGFNEKRFDKLLSIADSYGNKSVIYCTYEFAATMIPAEGWVSDKMRDDKWNNGYLTSYKNHQVVTLPQSFTDETNTTLAIDPSIAYIIPVGAEKPVKIVFEGNTITREFTGKDGSTEIQIYRKVGVGAIATNNICAYTNTDLAID